MQFLERVRSKSPSARAQYAFWTATLVTGLIGVVWVTTIPAHFSDISLSSKEGEETASLDSIFGEVKDQVANTIETTKEQLPTIETNNMDALMAGGDATTTLGMGTITSDMSTSTPESVPKEVVVEEKPEKQSTTTSVTTAAPPAPRVILIGTTTTQKSE